MKSYLANANIAVVITMQSLSFDCFEIFSDLAILSALTCTYVPTYRTYLRY